MLRREEKFYTFLDAFLLSGDQNIGNLLMEH